MSDGARRRRVELTVTVGGVDRDLAISASDDADDVVPALLEAAGTTHLEPADGRGGDLAQAVRQGAHLVDVATPPPPAPGPVEVAVVGGPDAGRRLFVGPGEHTIGRASDRAIRLGDRDVSRRHAVLVIAGDGSATVRDDGSENGTFVEELEATGSGLPVDGLLLIGSTAIAVGPRTEPDAALVADRAGGVRFHRRLREPAPEPPGPVESPVAPPEGDEAGNIAAVVGSVLTPLVSGVGFAVMSGRRAFLLIALTSPVVGVLLVWWQRRAARAKQARRRDAHREARTRAQRELAAARRVEGCHLREAAPDLPALVAAACGPTRLLWARRPTDADALVLRAGLADLPSGVPVRGPALDGQPPQPARPVTVDLRGSGSIGVAGPERAARAVARSLVLQATMLHGPDDLTLVVITPDDPTGHEWSWTRWLPHLRHPASSSALLVGSDEPTARTQIAVVRDLIASRREEGEQGGAPVTWAPVVVLWDRASTFAVELVADVLRGADVGVHSIVVEADPHLVPEDHCRSTVTLDATGGRATVRRAGRPTVAEVVVDHLAPALAERAARAVSPLRVASDGRAGVPPTARLLDVLGMRPPTPQAIARRWATHTRRADLLVGLGRDGPETIAFSDETAHGLVAGTNGSGKTQLVLGLLGAIALTHRPQDLSFLVIDFAGGGDYAGLAGLPHLVDTVTNIGDDGGGIGRALRLIDAEKVRRQALIREAKANDISGYWAVTADRPDAEPLGRLLVVIDEMAELVAQHPDQMETITSVARIGRKLGMHLLLCTQKPIGPVNAQTLANVAIRICMRVQKGEAREVIDSTAPEHIPIDVPCRGYLRKGPTGELIEIQATAAALPRPAARRQEPTRVEAWSWFGAAVATAEPPSARASVEQTDLYDVARAVCAAGEGQPGHGVPWPTPLPGAVPLEALPGRPTPDDVVIGLVDDMSDQSRRPLVLPDACGHLAIIGRPQSGRTTALRTIAAAVSAGRSPAEVHVHVVDLAGGALSSLGQLPTVGTVATELALAGRLVERLRDEVDDRRALFAQHGWGSYAEHLAHTEGATRRAEILLLVDGWDAVADHAAPLQAQVVHETIVRLVADGQSVGLRAVAAGGRGLAGTRSSGLFAERLVLALNDPADAGLVGLRPDPAAAKRPPGRGVLVSTGEEVQIAHVGSDPGGAAQADALRRRSGTRSRPSPPIGPFSIRPLPRQVSAASLEDERPPHEAVLPVCIGVGGEDASPSWIDLAATTPTFTIAGPARAGKTNLLRLVLGAVAVQSDVELVLLGRSAELAPHRARVRWSGETGDLRHEHVEPGDHHLVVVADDIHLLPSQHEVLTAATSAPGRGRRTLLVAGDGATLLGAYGWTLGLRRSGAGILLGPNDGALATLLGHPTVPTWKGRRWTAGRGVLATPEGFAEVQTAELPA